MTIGTLGVDGANRPFQATMPGDRRSAAPLALDPVLLATTYATHREAAYNLSFRILHDGPAAEDAVQDAFLKLWKGNAQFDPARGTMRGLLLTIVRHTSIDVIRKSNRRRRTEKIFCADATYVTDGPEHLTQLKDDSRELAAAMRGLPEEQRAVIDRAYFSGRSCRQIAGEMTLPIGTVKSRMRLGIRKLRSGLADPGA